MSVTFGLIFLGAVIGFILGIAVMVLGIVIWNKYLSHIARQG